MQCQYLEQRLFLSVTYIDGVVRITGSDKRDEIEVQINAFESGPSAYAIVNGKRTDFTTPDQSTGELPRKVVINGNAGDDVIELQNLLGHEVARIRGGAGDDTITLLNDQAVVKGGSGDDVIDADKSGIGPGHTVFGGNGNDLIRTPGVADHVFYGDAGNDTLIGGGFDDGRVVYGHNTLYGGPGDDLLKGGPGQDTLVGGPGDDILKGGSGDDVLKGGTGTDRFFGASGDDRCHVSKKEKFDPGKGKDKILRR